MSEQPTVLIVEDDALTALELSNLAAEMGCRVVGLASTGPRGVALADHHRPDLVLLDVKLAKGTDGLDAARQIRRQLKLDVVLVSGWLPDAGADELTASLPLIRKPFSADQIRALFRHRLGGGHDGTDEDGILPAPAVRALCLPALAPP